MAGKQQNMREMCTYLTTIDKTGKVLLHQVILVFLQLWVGVFGVLVQNSTLYWWDDVVRRSFKERTTCGLRVVTQWGGVWVLLRSWCCIVKGNSCCCEITL